MAALPAVARPPAKKAAYAAFKILFDRCVILLALLQCCIRAAGPFVILNLFHRRILQINRLMFQHHGRRFDGGIHSPQGANNGDFALIGHDSGPVRQGPGRQARPYI